MAPRREALVSLVTYFLKLGTIGFGGPVALVGFMHRDLVERRRQVTEDTYRLALAFAQIMPGPLAAQCAIALGYFEQGLLGATLVGLAFVLPSFVMVVLLSMAYVAFGGLWWMQALFYGIGAAVIGIIAIAAYKLARNTNKQDPLLWAIFALVGLVTVLTQAELAGFFILAGLLVLLVKAPPSWLKERLPFLAQSAQGLVVVPFLQVAPAAAAATNITPGPVVITVAFIGFLVAGFAGAAMAAVGIFVPVYIPAIVLSPWFKRHSDNAQLKAFVQGATAAATGAITGSVIILGQRAIFDLPTTAIGLGSLGALWRFKLHEPMVVAAAGLAGLALWPLLRGGAGA